jgi:hypothetical protein
MNPTHAFLLGLLITAGLGFSIVIYLKTRLKGILIDLCGTEVRADFWMAFSNVTLILVPMIFAMQGQPETNQTTSIIFLLSDQLKWAFIGLIISVAGLGAVLSHYIPDGPPQKAAKL